MKTFILLEEDDSEPIPIITFELEQKEEDFEFLIHKTKSYVKEHVERLDDYGKGFSFAHDEVNFQSVSTNTWSVYGYFVDTKNTPRVFYFLLKEK